MSTQGEDRRPCAGLWNTPMVYVNGDLTTCCLDQHLQNRLGNLREASLDTLWNGPTNHRWRVLQVLDDYAGSGPYCGHCNWRSAGAMPHDKVVQYLRKTGEWEALQRYEEHWKLPRSPRGA